MRKIQVSIELDDQDYHAYETEAARDGTTVEALVEQVIRELYRDLIQSEEEGDHPILLP